MARPPHIALSPLTVLAMVGIAGAAGLAFVNAPVRIIDGDTVELAGLGDVRIEGVDTPEPRGKCPREIDLAKAATARIDALLRSGPVSVTWPDGLRDNFGRPIVRISVDGRNVAETLIAEGLGREYHGGPRESWCE